MSQEVVAHKLTIEERELIRECFVVRAAQLKRAINTEKNVSVRRIREDELVRLENLELKLRG